MVVFFLVWLGLGLLDGLVVVVVVVWWWAIDRRGALEELGCGGTSRAHRWLEGVGVRVGNWKPWVCFSESRIGLELGFFRLTRNSARPSSSSASASHDLLCANNRGKWSNGPSLNPFSPLVGRGNGSPKQTLCSVPRRIGLGPSCCILRCVCSASLGYSVLCRQHISMAVWRESHG